MKLIILKILETMPQTNEVLKFTQLIGPFYEFVDDHTQQNGSLMPVKKKTHQTNLNKKKPAKSNSYVNGIGESKDNHHEHPYLHTNGSIEPLISAGNGPVPSSSSSSSSSSISSSGKSLFIYHFNAIQSIFVDVDEFYDDPSDRLPLNSHLPDDEMIDQLNTFSSNNELTPTTDIPQVHHHPLVYGGQDGNNLPVQRSNRGGIHSIISDGNFHEFA